MKKYIAFIALLVIIVSCATKKLKNSEAENQIKELKAENEELLKHIGDLEILQGDTDKDGVPDYLDAETNSVSGSMVDIKGRMIDKNNNGIPDDLEYLMNNKNNSTGTAPPPKPQTIVKYLKGTTKIITVQSEKLVLPENLIGNIAFNCPLEMREEQTYEVNAMLGTLFSKEEIQQNLLESINVSRKENNEPPITMKDVLTRQVNLGYYLNVTLQDDGNKFDIKKTNILANPETQSILDLSSGAFLKRTYLWQWNVTPKPKSKGEGTLDLLITPLNKNKIAMESKQKKYAITIHFKQSFLASFWEEMNRNIQWAIGSIIAPIITFFIGRYKRKEEKSNNLS